MFSMKIFNLLIKQKEIKDFLENEEKIEILVKKLNIEDIKRLNREYPPFLNFNQNDIESYIKKAEHPILSLTLLKHDYKSKNYNKLKKIKVYIDVINYIIIRIMQN